MVAVIAMLVAAPLGLGAAAYLSEYATPRTRRTLKPILETLAGIPSVVMGFFALQVINPDLVQQALRVGAAPSTTWRPASAVGILTIPLVASVAEDAMHAVPDALREACVRDRRPAHDGRRLRVVFPAAVSGIVAALILGFSRAVGETMVVAIAAGATGSAERTLNPLDARADDDRRDRLARDRIGSGPGLGASRSIPCTSSGCCCSSLTFLLNVVSERFVRRVQEQVLMSPSSPRPTPRTAVELALRGRRRAPRWDAVPRRPARDPAARRWPSC